MRFDVITLFPEMIRQLALYGVVGRAARRAIVQLHTWQLRDYADPPQYRVDERPYGGGPGMVLRADILDRALGDVRSRADEPSWVVAMGASGKPLSQDMVVDLAQRPRLVVLAGRYAGIDERFLDTDVDVEISVGDYILSGGELAAMVLIDAIARQLPDALGNAESSGDDGFGTEAVLDYPRYTRPLNYKEKSVPDVLLGGNHASIARWRAEQARKRTAERRPDLLPPEPDTTEK